MKLNEKLTLLFYLIFSGECGPMSGEDPYLDTDNNTIGLHSQAGTIFYTFNEDGSIDVNYSKDALREMEAEGVEEKYIPHHFKSLNNLITSGWGWFAYIDYKETLEDYIKRIVKNGSYKG